MKYELIQEAVYYIYHFEINGTAVHPRTHASCSAHRTLEYVAIR